MGVKQNNFETLNMCFMNLSISYRTNAARVYNAAREIS